uniref:Major facilitator superfamily (MFS) profile domain-containing protein n=1 Tax=Brassica oleracea TaxID=3712 RepID=A0A3P6DVB4_BRAOL|nr:unnamed protein product [Brassica oleracea]
MSSSAEVEKGVVTAEVEAPRGNRSRFAFACAILASMTSIILGYDSGVMSGAAIFIKEDLKLSDVQLEILMGILNIYSPWSLLLLWCPSHGVCQQIILSLWLADL